MCLSACIIGLLCVYLWRPQPSFILAVVKLLFWHLRLAVIAAYKNCVTAVQWTVSKQGHASAYAKRRGEALYTIDNNLYTSLTGWRESAGDTLTLQFLIDDILRATPRATCCMKLLLRCYRWLVVKLYLQKKVAANAVPPLFFSLLASLSLPLGMLTMWDVKKRVKMTIATNKNTNRPTQDMGNRATTFTS